jgi:2-keto-3-deoxy-6-phosphogluconate aldolase
MVPAGGTTIDTLAQNLDHPLIGAVAGSWIMPSELVRDKKWDAIGALAARSVQVVRDLEQRKRSGG